MLYYYNLYHATKYKEILNNNAKTPIFLSNMTLTYLFQSKTLKPYISVTAHFQDIILA